MAHIERTVCKDGLIVEVTVLDQHEIDAIPPNPFICEGGCGRVTANLTGTCASCQKRRAQSW